MKTKEIIVNGYKFTFEPTLSYDRCYRLSFGSSVVLDDSACADFYGDIDDVAEAMAEYIKEETEKAHPWFTLLGAIIEQGSDPVYIEDDKTAMSWGEVINGGRSWEITDLNEIEEVKPMLDLENCEVEHIYAFVNGCRGNFCLAQDY